MAICKYLGAGGIAGATGQWGAGLGRALGGLGGALGLGAAVDAATRAYTGYGLLETLSVPYIECADGSFATAMEWYGGGLKCPKRPEPISAGLPPSEKSSIEVGEEYGDLIERLGGLVFPYFGTHSLASVADVLAGKDNNLGGPGHFKMNDEDSYKYSGPLIDDKQGNAFKPGYTNSSSGYSDAYMFDPHRVYRDGRPDSENYIYRNSGWGGYGGLIYPAGMTYKLIRELRQKGTLGFTTKGHALLGVRISLPSLPFAPPAISNPPPPAFTPTPPPPKEDCEEMACPCITPDMIEKAVQKALGLKAFAPEKLIREIGAKIFVAPGPSLIPIVPKDLVEAIAAIVATNYMRAGYGRYPVLMPKSLINDNSAADAVPSEPIENYAEWFEWHLKQQDAIQGEWPVEIAIVDGAKRQPLKFENISEAFVELAGLTIQSATDADAAVAVATHAAVTAQKAHTASVIGQKNVECLIRFFGVRTGFKAVFIESAITPMDTDNPVFNLKKFLTPSTQSVAVLTDNDPFDFQAVLDRILRNSEIAKSAVALDAKTGLVGDYARNQRRYDTAEAKKEAEKELEKLQASINANNPDFKVKIRVDTAAPNDDLLGNNFVIKRPKLTNE